MANVGDVRGVAVLPVMGFYYCRNCGCYDRNASCSCCVGFMAA